MKQKTKEFLQKLADLMQEYEVELEITESCFGYDGFSVDGLDICVKGIDAESGYTFVDYATLRGKLHEARDILDILEESK